MSILSTASHTVTISIPHKPSLTASFLENKKTLLIGSAIFVIGLSIGIPIGAFIYDKITNAGLASCPWQQGSSSFWQETTLKG